MTVIGSIPTDGDVEAHYRQAREEISRISERIRMESLPDDVPPHRQISPPEWHTRPDAAEFMSIVRKTKQYIRESDIFQVVLSRRLTAEMHMDLLEVYRALRVRNPSPYMYYLRMGDIEIAGASPEMFIRLENGTLETSPIAGCGGALLRRTRRWNGNSKATKKSWPSTTCWWIWAASVVSAACM